VTTGRPFTCLLTDDRELLRLNRMFLGKAHPTDVLSFPSGIGAALGELAISVDRAREQAEEHGHSLAEELKILMLHGVLHLLGFDHEADRGTMARAERRWREQFGLRTGLIERSRQKRIAEGK
jgi:probable rRNA maturation factor